MNNSFFPLSQNLLLHTPYFLWWTHNRYLLNGNTLPVFGKCPTEWCILPIPPIVEATLFLSPTSFPLGLRPMNQAVALAHTCVRFYLEEKNMEVRFTWNSTFGSSGSGGRWMVCGDSHWKASRASAAPSKWVIMPTHSIGSAFDMVVTACYSWLQRLGAWPSGPPEDSEICQIFFSKFFFN